MFALSVTPELLTAVFAALLAILFDWFPPVSQWYDTLSVLKKKQIMALGLVLIVAAIYGGTCLSLFSGTVTCDKAGITSLVYSILIALGINQGVHSLAKPVKEIAV